MKKQTGITLISLVITIIVMLILAGVTLNVLVGNNGVLTQAIDAKTSYEKAEEEELIDIAYSGSQMNTYPYVDFDTFSANIKDTFGEEARVEKHNIDGNISYKIILRPNEVEGNQGIYYRGSNMKALDILVEDDSTVAPGTIDMLGYEIALNHKIGLTFYFSIPEEIYKETMKLKITSEPAPAKCNNTEYSITEINTVEGKMFNGKTIPKCYYITVYGASNEMSNKITLFIDGEKIGSYSIEEYGKYVIGHEGQYIGKDAEVAYIKAMLNYGARSQQYFIEYYAKAGTDEAKAVSETFNKGLANDETILEPPLELREDYYEPYKKGKVIGEGIKYFAHPSAAFDAGLELIIYIAPEFGELEASEGAKVKANNGQTYDIELVESGTYKDYYRAHIPVHLTKETEFIYELYIVDNNGNTIGKGVTYSMNTYNYTMLKTEGDTTMRRLVQALELLIVRGKAVFND